MIKKVDGKYAFVQPKAEAEANPSRRDMAMALAGIFGASAFLKGCAPAEGVKAGDGSEEKVGGGVSNATGTFSTVLWVDDPAELKSIVGSYGPGGPGVAISRDFKEAPQPMMPPDTRNGLNLGVFIWTDDDISPESIMVFPAPAGSPTGSWKRVHSGPINVQWFGARGDTLAGTDPLALPTFVDQTQPIQEAIDYIVNNGGGELYFPPGYYVVSDTINIGNQLYDGYGFLFSRQDPVDDPELLAHYAYSGVEIDNEKKYPISLIFDEGAYIVAAFDRPTPTPVIAYNLGNQRGSGVVRNLKVMTFNAIRLQPDGTWRHQIRSDALPTNNLIGFASGTGCRILEHALFVDLRCGVLAIAAYWMAIREVTAFACGDALNIAQGNGMAISNILMIYCDNGIVFSGASVRVSDFTTEQVNTDLVIISADVCTFGPAYLEDTRDYPNPLPKPKTPCFIRCGVSSTGKAVNCSFDNVRVGNAGHKYAMILTNTSQATFRNTRVYSGLVDVWDDICGGTIINCDFAIPGRGWTVINYKAGNLSRFAGQIQPGSNLVLLGVVCYPFSYNFGTIPGGATHGSYILPQKLELKNMTYATLVHLLGATDDGRRAIFRADIVNSDEIKLMVTNPLATSLPVDGASGNVIVHIYEPVVL